MSEEIISGIGKDFIIPNFSKELRETEKKIDNIKYKFKLKTATKCLDGKCHTELYEEIAIILDYVGKLSLPIFQLEDALEEEYKMKYLHSPELSKKLFWEHYENLHHPYTLLKNRCFRLFEELDEEYIRINKNTPPNWKI